MPSRRPEWLDTCKPNAPVPHCVPLFELSNSGKNTVELLTPLETRPNVIRDSSRQSVDAFEDEVHAVEQDAQAHAREETQMSNPLRQTSGDEVSPTRHSRPSVHFVAKEGGGGTGGGRGGRMPMGRSTPDSLAPELSAQSKTPSHTPQTSTRHSTGFREQSFAESLPYPAAESFSEYSEYPYPGESLEFQESLDMSADGAYLGGGTPQRGYPRGYPDPPPGRPPSARSMEGPMMVRSREQSMDGPMMVRSMDGGTSGLSLRESSSRATYRSRVGAFIRYFV
jgi:hypothetical protein